ncbi:MAG: DUF2339 domain-containing protein [Treponema sp.]|jgi:uncharacterized membrane protein|nr:DUF2339 domain-containing protein [Treponema sp.]
MEGIVFTIIAVFLFAVIGVIALLVRTANQAERLREYGRRIGLLEEGVRSLISGRTHTAGMEAGTESAGVSPPVMEASPAEPVEFAVPAASAPAASMPAASMPVEAADFVPADTVTSVPVETPAPPALKNSLTAFIRGGNLWAAGGIILLIAAFAMLITYLANRGFFTVEMGIAGAALSGLVMLAAGWRFRNKRPVYFLLFQGGGIGILYLSVFAAHRLTSYFPPLVSLILLSVLLPPALILAFFQGSQALALLGFLGGFAAPLLLAPGGGNYVFIFAYYGVLDLGVLVISLFRRWKGLNFLAFLCTFGFAVSWTAVYYDPTMFWRTEPFFLAYIAIFTILGIHGFGAEKTRRDTFFDLILVLGTPLAGAVLQWTIFDPVPHGHALICLIFSALYIFLALIIRKRRGGAMRIFAEGYIGLALLLVNLAIPLELAPRITSAVWAAEGVVVFFFGLRLKNCKTAAAGLILHLAAALAFAAEQAFFVYGGGAFRSVRFIGSLVIAFSAMVMVFITGHSPHFSLKTRNTENRVWLSAFPVILGIWAFSWWFGGWFYEIYRSLDNPGAAVFLFCSASALAAFAGSKFLRVPVYRTGMIPAPVFGLYLVLSTFIIRTPYFVSQPRMILSHNFFQGPFLWGWIAFFAVQALLLLFLRKELWEELHSVWFLIDIFIALSVISSSGRALTLSREFAPAWTSLAGMAPVFITMTGIGLLARRLWTEPEFGLKGEIPPSGRVMAAPYPLCGGELLHPPAPSAAAAGFRKRIFFFVLPLVLSCIMGIWFFVTLFLSGDPAPLPFYIPVINPLDLEEAFCIVLFLLWQSALQKQQKLPRLKKPALFTVIDGMIFLFSIAVIARSVHFYGDVPYRRVFSSELFHLCLFILWAVYGIGHIIWGSRLSLRKVWIAGAVLTVADIGKLLILDLAGTGAVTRIVSFFIAGLLLLFIGWIAPLPPAAEKQPSPETKP